MMTLTKYQVISWDSVIMKHFNIKKLSHYQPKVKSGYVNLSLVLILINVSYYPKGISLTFVLVRHGGSVTSIKCRVVTCCYVLMAASSSLQARPLRLSHRSTQ